MEENLLGRSPHAKEHRLSYKDQITGLLSALLDEHPPGVADGIHYLHLRPTDAVGAFARCGGYTVAYRLQRRGTVDNIVDVAWSLCRPCDSFDRKLGRQLALCRILDGKHLPVRLPLKGQYSQQLKVLLTPFLWNSQDMVEMLQADEEDPDDERHPGWVE